MPSSPSAPPDTGPVETGPDAGTGATAGARPTGADRSRVRRLTVLGVVAVLLLAGAALLAVGWRATVATGPLANDAFVDSGAIAEVVGQVSQAMVVAYSYDYRTLPADEQAARAAITGPLAERFDKVFEPIKQLAPQQQAVFTTSVRAAGVTLLQGDRARLLMMVDQRGTHTGGQQVAPVNARLVVDAVRVDGTWKVAEVTPE